MAIVVESVSTGGWGTGAVSVTAPTGITEGDLLFALIGYNRSSLTVSSPSGWSTIDSSEPATESAMIQYKVATSADESAGSYTWTESGGFALGITMLRISGAAVDFSIKNKDFGDSASPLDLGITPSQANSLLLFCVCDVNTSVTGNTNYSIATDNPTWTESVSLATGSGMGELSIATATRPETTATGDWSMSDVESVIAFSIALPPRIDGTATISPINLDLSIQSVTLTGTANTSVSAINLAITIKNVVAKGFENIWSYVSKSSAPTWTNQDESKKDDV